jgi:hypothetical protein
MNKANSHKKLPAQAIAAIFVFAVLIALAFAWAVFADVIILRKTEGLGGAERAISILYVGDSFIFVGGLPRQLQAIARASGIDTSYKDISRHANRGGTLKENMENAIRELQSGRYSYIVIHDQNRKSLSDIEGLLADIQTLCNAAVENGAIPVLYDFAGIAAHGKPDEERLSISINAYRQAANSNNAILVRAAEAWVYAYQAMPEISLYTRFDPRGLNPSRAGGFMSACVFAAEVFGIQVTQMPKGSIYTGSDALGLAQAAWDFASLPRE